MTAASFAEMVNARRCGAGEWQARCPAHGDRSPSLSIAEGMDGRVLVRCMAGCSTESVCASLGIALRDLFAGKPLTPEQRAKAAHQKALRDAAERQQRAIDRAARDRLRKLERLMNGLGAKLMRNPDNPAMGALFHRVCDALHDAETAMNETRPAENEPLERTA